MPRLFSRRDFMAAGAIALGSAPFVGVDRVFARQGSEAVSATVWPAATPCAIALSCGRVSHPVSPAQRSMSNG